MAVEKQYLSDVEAILSHRYDNGGDLWATPDKRLLKGAPFSTLENILLLLEVGMELSEPLLKEAIDLIFSTWQKDGRFKIYPQGGIYPCHTAHAADTLCHMGYVSDARLKKLSGTFWIFNMSMAAGAAISSVLAGARKQIIQTPSQHLPFRVHSALVTISTKNRRLIER